MIGFTIFDLRFTIGYWHLGCYDRAAAAPIPAPQPPLPNPRSPIQNLKSKILLLLAFAPLFTFAQSGPCACTNCPKPMPDGFSGNFSIQVQGATNPILGQNGQAICRVRLKFQHAYIGDLRISLTAPNGTTVALVGPVGLFNPTNFSEWDVSFIPCAEMPSPDAGIAGQWSNTQPWGILGNYKGRYHPFVGCLEDFNGAPVNGEWLLKVEDLQTGDMGTFLDYEVVFCDPAGIECTYCAANAGVFAQNKIAACAGTPALDLNLPPIYIDPTKRPPAAEYGYTYAISGPGNVLLEYNRAADLRSYPPGRYTVCGLSYLLQQQSKLPAPNGSLTYNDLALRLNSTAPPFCGQLTPVCAEVTIFPQPRDTILDTLICAGTCLSFLGETYCLPGAYTRSLQDAAGCAYQATLNLDTLPKSVRMLYDTICAGDCAPWPGFEQACAAGTYRDTFVNAHGCDSIVTLILTVRTAPVRPSLLSGADTLFCPGDTLRWVALNSAEAQFIRWEADDLSLSPKIGDTLVLPWPTVGDTLRWCAYAVNNCGDSPPVCQTAFGLRLPSMPVLWGRDTACNGSSERYYIDSIDLAGTYDWQIKGGAIVKRWGRFGVEVEWADTATAGEVCVFGKNQCGMGPSLCQTVWLGQAPTAQRLIGDTAYCAGLLGERSFYRAVGQGAIAQWTWLLPPAAQAAATLNTDTLTLTWLPPGGRLCAVARGVCGAYDTVCLDVRVRERPLADAGLDADTCGNALPLRALAANGAGHWEQVFGPNGASPILENGPMAAENVLRADWPGLYHAIWSVSNGGCAASDTVALLFKAVPEIGAPIFVCDSIQEHFRVVFPIIGGNAPFNVNGTSFFGASYTSMSMPDGADFKFVAGDVNGCQAPPFEGAYLCPCASQAGDMLPDTLLVCGADSVLVGSFNETTQMDPNDAVSYAMHSNPEAALGTVWAQNKTGLFHYMPGMAYGLPYYVSQIVGNAAPDGQPDPKNRCFSVSPGQPIVFYPIPKAKAGSDADTCALVWPLQADAQGGAGRWSVLEAPAGAQATFLQNLDTAKNQVTVDSPGIYRFIWRVSNRTCSAEDTVTIHFLAPPYAKDLIVQCDEVGENYSVSFELAGGRPPFAVNGDTVQGQRFVSQPIRSGTPYQFQLRDASGCAAPDYIGDHHCLCLSNAGTMSQSPLEVCADGEAQAMANPDAFSDPNDAVSFVLHERNDSTLGRIWDENANGRFRFLPGMAFDTRYYVSRIVGNALNGAPDKNNACLSVALGQPVVFRQKPQADAGLDADTCGNALSLAATLDFGVGRWNLSDSALTLESGVLAAQNTVTASKPGAFWAVWAVANGACTTMDSVRLRFWENPSATIQTLACDSVAEQFRLTLNIAGGAAPYMVNDSLWIGDIVETRFMPRGQPYRYTIQDANGCVAPILEGVGECTCLSEAAVLDTQLLRVCGTDTVRVVERIKANLDPNDVAFWVMHDGNSDTLGQILDIKTTGLFTWKPGLIWGKRYYLSHVTGNSRNGAPDWSDPCLSVSKGQPLVFYAHPQVQAGADLDTCGLVLPLNGQTDVGVGTWIAPQNAALQITPDNKAVLTDKSGTYRLIWHVNNEGCASDDTITLRFYPVPAITHLQTTCDNLNEHYTVAWTASGGMPPYWSNGTLLTDSLFKSNPLPSGTAYTYTLSDANNCAAPTLNGEYRCICASAAGIMPTGILETCVSDSATAGVPVGAFLDGNDGHAFVLHTAAGTSLGKVWGQNTTGRFAFQPGMSTDTLYYVSHVVGNLLNGIPDTNDVCYSIAPGQPLRFLPAPVPILEINPVRCYGEKNGTILVKQEQGAPPILYALDTDPLSAKKRFEGLPPGTYLLRAEDANGCTWTSEPIQIDAPPPLVVRFDNPLKVMLGDTLRVTADISVPFAALDTLVWTPLLDSAAKNLPWQWIAPVRSLPLSVWVRDTNGCVAYGNTHILVQRHRRIYVPNVVTLEDGPNGALTVFGGADVETVVSFEVFDRWGNLLYRRSNFQAGSPDPNWQDYFRGNRGLPGIFTYLTKILWKDGETDIFSGDLFLIK